MISLMSDELHEVKKDDVKRAAIVLANAFSEDPMCKIIFKGKYKAARAFFEISIRFSLKYGTVFSTSDKFEGLMATLPHDKEYTAWRIIRSGAFLPSMKIMGLYNKMKELMKLMDDEKKHLMIGPYIYLAVIGVSPEFQGKGFGGKILRVLVEKADREREALYLETQNESNLKLYEKYGFHIHKKLNVPVLNIPMWSMIRDAN